jgi:putative spermidine/putrescine transport system substrate-binding protein
MKHSGPAKRWPSLTHGARRSSVSVAAALITFGAANATAEPRGDGEGSVHILAWPGYIERGDTNPAYDWVIAFEKATSCKVRVTTAHTSDEMVALMNDGGFDLVTASGDATLRLIAGARVREIDPNTIEGWDTIDPRLQDAPWHTVKGKHYGVPYQWGANVLLYDPRVFPTPPPSWRVVFEPMTLPDGKPNSGRVQAFNGAIYIADAALYLMEHRPSLRIRDPYELSETQYQAALELLRGQRKLVRRYWHDPLTQVQDFAAGGFVASPSWPYQVNLLRSRGLPVASTIPREGATGWADTTMIHAEAQHPNCAHLWLQHSLDRKVQGDVAAWFGSVPVVPSACEGNSLLGPDGCRINGADEFARIRFWRTPTARCATQPECVPYYRWVSDYMAVLGGD